ncbi:MAG TPA: histidine kinase [Hyphomicrobiales bacterium]|nr:histidine kinase [Hyphomicrobiales bacterium]
MSTHQNKVLQQWPVGLLKPLLAAWGLFWLLMILVAVHDNFGGPVVRWWQPLVWEGSSALVLTALLVIMLRYSRRQQALLATPWRWFWQHLQWLPLLSGLFVLLTYGLRHLAYGLAGLTYEHEGWLMIWAYETLKLALFLGLWLGVLFGLQFFAGWHEQQGRLLAAQRTLAEARLLQLKSQLQPHFLFNTLNTISALIPTDPERADVLVNRLADLLRGYLSLDAATLVPLREEVRLLQHYADIMTSRFAPRVAVRWQLAIAALERSVPPLLLQPLLENAFRHGVEPSLAPVTIDIDARVDDDVLVLRLRNAPAAGGHRAGAATDGNGIGLRNCRERLRAQYGLAASLTTEQQGDAFIVTIRIGASPL